MMQYLMNKSNNCMIHDLQHFFKDDAKAYVLEFWFMEVN